MSQINLKKQSDVSTYIPDVGYVAIFYSNDLNAWAYKDSDGVVRPMLAQVEAYIHDQSSALDIWTINHNLGFKPTVTVFSVGGMEVEADVQHTSINQTIIYFNNPFAGSARLT